jgi:hypothetical protein
VDLEALDRLIAEEFQAIAALDERDALGCQTLKFERIAPLNRSARAGSSAAPVIGVEFAFNAVGSAVE